MGLKKYIASRYGSKKGLARLTWFHTVNALTKHYEQYHCIPKNTLRIVFVCKGNICRSALAEHYFRGISDFPAVSVGLDTHTGKPANERIAKETKLLGIDLSLHRTTAIADLIPQEGDLYVCMEPSNIKSLYQAIGKKPVVLLGLYGAPKRIYIHDPYISPEGYVQFCNSYIISSVKSLEENLSKRKHN